MYRHACMLHPWPVQANKCHFTSGLHSARDSGGHSTYAYVDERGFSLYLPLHQPICFNARNSLRITLARRECSESCEEPYAMTFILKVRNCFEIGRLHER